MGISIDVGTITFDKTTIDSFSRTLKAEKFARKVCCTFRVFCFIPFRVRRRRASADWYRYHGEQFLIYDDLISLKN